jgi:peptidoglycan-associated lipoprotein
VTSGNGRIFGPFVVTASSKGGSMIRIAVCLIVFAALMAGCAPKTVQTEPGSGRTPVQPGLQTGREEGRVPGRGGITEEELAEQRRRDIERERALLAGPGEAARMSDIPFDFDSYTIKPEFAQDLTHAAEWLKRNPGVKVLLEGNTDERGTIEYNMVLGQRRAEAVRDFLVRMGVDRGRISTVSLGKENPVDPAHSEEAWARNRRVHLVIDQKRGS